MPLPTIDFSALPLPTIDLSALPDLSHVVGLFGSLVQAPGSDDSIVILATFVFESVPPGSGGII